MNDALFNEYEKYLEYDQQKLSSLKKQIRLLSVLRLLAFVAIFLPLFFIELLGLTVVLIIVGISLVLFLIWIKKFIQDERKKQLYEKLVEINQNEILAISEIYTPFKNGEAFKDSSHAFSGDLDLFGEGSVFQFLNRTTTQLGEKRLANFIKNLLIDVKALESRQETLKELSKHVRWRQFFAAKGQTHDDEDFQLLKSLSENPVQANWTKIKWLIYIFPALSFCLLVLWAFSIVPWGLFVLSIMVNMIILGLHQKVISSFYNRFGRQSKILQSYLDLILLIEKKDFQAPELVALQQKLVLKEKKASAVFENLKQIMARFDYRINLIFAFVGELIFLWDLICIFQLNNWNRKYKDFFLQCFDVIAEFDALCSLANLNHNQPEWTVPSFEKNEFHYAANELAHPLIHSEKRIGNSFRMNGDGQITIITGANMAGKSTFLRALGVNFILALNGCRVCANWFTVRPAALYTNMRTTDNLQKDESYFFAELLRLQTMLERIRNGEKLFLLIDEMLKGTNSQDKLSGSKELVKQLVKLEANGVVATHDLELTRLSDSYPANIRNMCFDIRLKDDELVFDYQLTEGVTSTMNASFLMRKMGIIAD